MTAVDISVLRAILFSRRGFAFLTLGLDRSRRCKKAVVRGTGIKITERTATMRSRDKIARMQIANFNISNTVMLYRCHVERAMSFEDIFRILYSILIWIIAYKFEETRPETHSWNATTTWNNLKCMNFS